MKNSTFQSRAANNLTAASEKAQATKAVLDLVKSTFKCKTKILQRGGVNRIELVNLSADPAEFKAFNTDLTKLFPNLTLEANAKIAHSMYVSYQLPLGSGLDFVTIDGLYGMLYLQ